jgi:Flp pilus assembly protein TadD
MNDLTPADARVRELVDNGRAARARGDHVAALALFSEAAEIAPLTPHVLIALGNILFDTKSYEKAKEVYGRVLEKNPKNSRAHYGLGRIARQASDTDTVLEHFKVATSA